MHKLSTQARGAGLALACPQAPPRELVQIDQIPAGLPTGPPLIPVPLSGPAPAISTDRRPARPPRPAGRGGGDPSVLTGALGPVRSFLSAPFPHLQTAQRQCPSPRPAVSVAQDDTHRAPRHALAVRVASPVKQCWVSPSVTIDSFSGCTVPLTERHRFLAKRPARSTRPGTFWC